MGHDPFGRSRVAADWRVRRENAGLRVHGEELDASRADNCICLRCAWRSRAWVVGGLVGISTHAVVSYCPGGDARQGRPGKGFELLGVVGSWLD